MGDFTVFSTPGSVDSQSMDDGLFLKVFAGEVLTAFEEKNVMQNRHLIRTITSGKSAQFPATWKAGAEYHTPGAELTGGEIKHNERVIVIDALLISDVFVPVIEEAKNHYDVRSIYSTQIGRALANKWDRNVLRTATLAARVSTELFSGAPVGYQVKDASMATVADDLAYGIMSAAQRLDENDVPDDDRCCFLRPAQYYLLIKSDKAINRDVGGAAANGGGFASGKVWSIADIEIVKTNNVPGTDDSSYTPSKYAGNFTLTLGVVMHKSAVGTVKLLDLATEMEYSARHQGTLMLGKYAVGHGILRPECAVELYGSDS